MIEDKVLSLATTLDREALIDALRKEADAARGRARSGPASDDSLLPDEEELDAARYDRVVAFLETGSIPSDATDHDRSLCDDVREMLNNSGNELWPI
jgi:hypothetical protein